MKKIFSFISLLFFYFINVFGEIPTNVIINNSKSIEYETIDNETNEVILEYQPKGNEKIIRFVAISSKEKFPISIDNVKDKYGIISYKTNKLLEN